MGATIRALRARGEALATPKALAVAEAGRLRVYAAATWAAATSAASAATPAASAAAASAAPSLGSGRWLCPATAAVAGFGFDRLGVVRGTLLLAPPFPLLALAAPSGTTASSARVA